MNLVELLKDIRQLTVPCNLKIRQEIIINNLTSTEKRIKDTKLYDIKGKVTSAVGTCIFAYIPSVSVGDICIIENPDNQETRTKAEVIAIKDNGIVILMAFSGISEVSSTSTVTKFSNCFTVKLHPSLLGCIVNGVGEITGTLLNDPVIKSEDLTDGSFYPVMAASPDPLTRPIIKDKLHTGVKAIDLFVPVGAGQRLAIFAPPGVGKTTLMGMIIRNSMVDVVVVALIGERGREVNEFIEVEINQTLREKCVLVLTTSDRPPVEQVKTAYIAQTIAEYFSDQGKNVLLFMDSITRFARAQREVGLSIGEPITNGGFPPSVFLALPKLMERAGTRAIGKITAFYTVLLEKGDNFDSDPIASEIKSIVDGHIILSKSLAESGQYPAIDIQSSLSRIADKLVSTEHIQATKKILLLLTKYKEVEFLLRINEYNKGVDLIADEAIEKNQKIINLLKQTTKDNFDYNVLLKELMVLSG